MQPVLPHAKVVLPYLESMDRSGIYSNRGPLVRMLESRYADFLHVDADQVVATANATQGLAGAVVVAALDHWIVPDWTFPATGHAVLNAGRKAVLHDVRRGTWALSDNWNGYSPSEGIVAVVPFGLPFSTENYAMDQSFVLDAAASLGCQPNLSSLVRDGAVVFSLHATKVLGGGEGGIVVFGSSERAREFRSWINFGFSGGRVASHPGTNAKMPEAIAAYCLAALDDWDNERDSWLRARSEATRVCLSLGLDCWRLSSHTISPYWLILCKSANERRKLSHALERSGVDSRRWWPSPLHKMQAFSHCDLSVIESESVSSDLASRVLGLPFFRNFDKCHANRIQEVLGECLMN